jgi:hypothetical protein
MKRTLRLTVLALASLFTLAFATSAWASYTPKLVADPKSEALNGGGPFTLTFSQPADDQATAKATIYTPNGFATDVSQAIGSKLGTVKANVIAKGLGGIPLKLTGTIETDNPANYVANPCAPGTHQAVWLMVLTASNQTLKVPMYVDSITSGPEAAFASMKIQVCLPSPDVPPEQGGATFGAKLVTAQLNFSSGIWTNPATRGAYAFSSIATPYDVNSGTIRPDQTVEARGIVQLPVSLSLNAKAGARGTVVLSGGIATAGRAAAAAIRLYAGPTSKRTKVIASKASRAGKYAFAVRVRKTTFFKTSATAPQRNVTAAGCAAPSPAPGGCVSATLEPFQVFSSHLVKVIVRKP